MLLITSNLKQHTFSCQIQVKVKIYSIASKGIINQWKFFNPDNLGQYPIRKTTGVTIEGSK